MARFQDAVGELLVHMPRSSRELPSFESHRTGYEAGTALLLGEDPGPRLVSEAAEHLGALLEIVARSAHREAFFQRARELAALADSQPDLRSGWVARLVSAGGVDPAVPHAGTLAFLGFVALAWSLEPVIAAFDRWRDESAWARPWCPTCGAAPNQSQLVPLEAGRQRRLVCGRCWTRWNARRLGCVQCGAEAEATMRILEVADEPDLRIEVCDRCRGYLKTWAGEGDGGFLLEDWTTLHLDLLAADAGYRRVGASRYEIGGSGRHEP